MRLLLILVTCALASGCGLLEGVGTAEKAVITFHEQFNAGGFEVIYDAGADDLRAAEARSEFIATLTALRAKLGQVRDSQRTGFNSRVGSDGTFVELEYETNFDNGEGTEEFTWAISDGQARLLGYNVTSRALLR
jgi:hypothetical protein